MILCTLVISISCRKHPHHIESTRIRVNPWATLGPTMRWKGKGEIQHDGWKFLFCGRADDQKEASGVGLALSPDWVKAWSQAGNAVTYISDRIMKARFKKRGR